MQGLPFPKINKPNLVQLLQQLMMMELNANEKKNPIKIKGRKIKNKRKERKTWNLSLEFYYLTLCFSTCNITRVNND